MRLHYKLTLTLAVIALFFCFGCAGKPIKMVTVGDNFDISNYDLTHGRQISASASGFQLFLFIPISINSRHDRAYQDLLNESRGDYITDIKIEESWFYGFVGTGYTTTLTATAYPRIN